MERNCYKTDNRGLLCHQFLQQGNAKNTTTINKEAVLYISGKLNTFQDYLKSAVAQSVEDFVGLFAILMENSKRIFMCVMPVV